MDWLRYASIVSRSAFNAEFFRGCPGDRSVLQRAYVFQGTPIFRRLGCGSSLGSQLAGVCGMRTATTWPPIVSVTTAFSVEVLFSCDADISDCYFLDQSGLGGFYIYRAAATGRIMLRTFTNAGAAARTTQTPAASTPARQRIHAVGTIDPVALTSTWTLNGVPVLPSFANAGVPADLAVGNIYYGGGGHTGTFRTSIVRVWSGTLTSSEIDLLYKASMRLGCLDSCAYHSFPSRFAAPEKDVLASFTCDRESTPARIIDKTGNGYDLTLPTGSVATGWNGGIRVDNDAGSFWRGPSIPVGGANFSYAAEIEHVAAVNAVVITNSGHRIVSDAVAGGLGCSLDGGVTVTATAYSLVGRGICRVGALYDGANQILTINGRRAGAGAVVPVVPAGNLQIGSLDTVTRYKARNRRFTEIEDRAEYVREFARVPRFVWRPGMDGESSFDIAANQTGDGWLCVATSAGLRFVWLSNIDKLAIQSNTATTGRITIARGQIPSFGHWHTQFTVRNNASDDLRIGMIDAPATDLNAVGTKYWVRALCGGGVITISLYRSNVVIVTGQFALPGNGTNHVIDFARHPSGDWYLYYDSLPVGLANDVTYVAGLTHYAFQPGGCSVFDFAEYQGEMTPGEVAVAI